MKPRALAIVLFPSLLAAGACHRAADGPGAPANAGPPTGAAAARVLLAAGADLAGTANEVAQAWAFDELDRIAARVRAERQRDPAAAPAAAINRTLFDVLAFSREVDDQDIAYVLLPSVLRLHRGSCVGLGALYLALAALLDVPATGVVVPGHFFVRVDDQQAPGANGGWRNVELLRRGEQMKDDWYRARWPVAGAGSPASARSLSLDEVRGVIEYDVGQQWMRLDRLLEARRAYEAAAAHFPGFAEAQASLGRTRHLLGALDGAASAYAAARLAYPDLPGLSDNIKLIESERHPTGADNR
ncbi:MAG TPA: transglutaminase family protein [Polyangia bacterium]|nr:transglutaminase family protein [Polyangia bacterium]